MEYISTWIVKFYVSDIFFSLTYFRMPHKHLAKF